MDKKERIETKKYVYAAKAEGVILKVDLDGEFPILESVDAPSFKSNIDLAKLNGGRVIIKDVGLFEYQADVNALDYSIQTYRGILSLMGNMHARDKMMNHLSDEKFLELEDRLKKVIAQEIDELFVEDIIFDKKRFLQEFECGKMSTKDIFSEEDCTWGSLVWLILKWITFKAEKAIINKNHAFYPFLGNNDRGYAKEIFALCKQVEDEIEHNDGLTTTNSDEVLNSMKHTLNVLLECIGTGNDIFGEKFQVKSWNYKSYETPLFTEEEKGKLINAEDSIKNLINLASSPDKSEAIEHGDANGCPQAGVRKNKDYVFIGC